MSPAAAAGGACYTVSGRRGPGTARSSSASTSRASHLAAPTAPRPGGTGRQGAVRHSHRGTGGVLPPPPRPRPVPRRPMSGSTITIGIHAPPPGAPLPASFQAAASSEDYYNNKAACRGAPSSRHRTTIPPRCPPRVHRDGKGKMRPAIAPRPDRSRPAPLAASRLPYLSAGVTERGPDHAQELFRHLHYLQAKADLLTS